LGGDEGRPRAGRRAGRRFAQAPVRPGRVRAARVRPGPSSGQPFSAASRCSARVSAPDGSGAAGSSIQSSTSRRTVSASRSRSSMCQPSG